MTRTIAVIDDREEVRKLVSARINRALEQPETNPEWSVVVSPPLQSLSNYQSWIEENEVVVLLLDQRLNEQGDMVEPYNGSDIVARLRPREFDLPIYYITDDPHDAMVMGDVNRVNGIIGRTDFTGSSLDGVRTWTKEFMREGVRYEQQVAHDLARLGEIADMIVEGTATDEEITEAASLRQQLSLPYEGGDVNVERANASRAEVLSSFGDAIKNLEDFAAEVEQIIKDSRSKTVSDGESAS